MPREVIELNNKPRVVGSSSTSEYKDVRIDEILPTNSCGLCDMTCAPQMKECLKFLNKKGPSKEVKHEGNKKKKNKKAKHIWLPCGLLAMLQILRRDKVHVDGNVVKPVLRTTTPKWRQCLKNWGYY